ncbi:hypothetical protein [Saccharibacillus alkalitolerans]|uniref:Uncharacterized protein n=1 Tax=Saccharibacillus alkalitolerans TaxID=2705290 RepID=A0ABX0F8Q8_9BACL|nr:hypothetical protein [Saccharibacillus alkalitolerans]NGZ75869.1 hypothetical protein [Saccharibacillus alkalitolerans]
MKKNKAIKLLKEAYGRLFGQRDGARAGRGAAGASGRLERFAKPGGPDFAKGLNEEWAAGSLRARS